MQITIRTIFPARIQSAVSEACSRRASRGFLWRYDTGNHEDIPPYHRGKAVLQIDPETWQMIAEYQYLAEAAKATGAKSSNIFHVCRRRCKTAGGYVWRYADDPDEKAPNRSRCNMFRPGWVSARTA